MTDMVKEDAEFWLVWTKNGRNPRRSHTTEESAITEAERLARKFPGTKFLVLRCVTKRIVPNPIPENTP
jgi:hypothetical protein